MNVREFFVLLDVFHGERQAFLGSAIRFVRRGGVAGHSGPSTITYASKPAAVLGVLVLGIAWTSQWRSRPGPALSLSW